MNFTYNLPLDLGFYLLAEQQKLKFALDAAGEHGMVSYIKAVIASGINEHETILDAVLALTGDHAECMAERIIWEGENIHWAKDKNGRHTVLSVPAAN